jgi:hypothetical protein
MSEYMKFNNAAMLFVYCLCFFSTQSFGDVQASNLVSYKGEVLARINKGDSLINKIENNEQQDSINISTAEGKLSTIDNKIESLKSRRDLYLNELDNTLGTDGGNKKTVQAISEAEKYKSASDAYNKEAQLRSSAKIGYDGYKDAIDSDRSDINLINGKEMELIENYGEAVKSYNHKVFKIWVELRNFSTGANLGLNTSVFEIDFNNAANIHGRTQGAVNDITTPEYMRSGGARKILGSINVVPSPPMWAEREIRIYRPGSMPGRSAPLPIPITLNEIKGPGW